MAFILDERPDTRSTPGCRAPCSSNQAGDATLLVVESLTTAFAGARHLHSYPKPVRALIA
jgi:hypothetical protein